jgi:hypothetical protein
MVESNARAKNGNFGSQMFMLFGLPGQNKFRLKVRYSAGDQACEEIESRNQ